MWYRNLHLCDLRWLCWCIMKDNFCTNKHVHDEVCIFIMLQCIMSDFSLHVFISLNMKTSKLYYNLKSTFLKLNLLEIFTDLWICINILCVMICPSKNLHVLPLIFLSYIYFLHDENYIFHDKRIHFQKKKIFFSLQLSHVPCLLQ